LFLASMLLFRYWAPPRPGLREVPAESSSPAGASSCTSCRAERPLAAKSRGSLSSGAPRTQKPAAHPAAGGLEACARLATRLADSLHAAGWPHLLITGARLVYPLGGAAR